MQLINKYPIQIFPERVLINDEKKLLYYFNNYNGKKTFYYTLYSPEVKTNNNNCCSIKQNNYHFCNANVDKIGFDMDNLNSSEVIKKFHRYCLKNNLKHLMLFSGCKGFHIYIFTKNYNNLKNPKNALLNVHNYFIKQLNLHVNGNGTSDVDSILLGDIARHMRLPNTMHLSSKLFCIPISTIDLVLGKSHIMQKAKKQNFNFIYYGTEYLDMQQFDTNIVENVNTNIDFDISIEVNTSEILKEFPPCLKVMISQDYVYWRQRFHILKYLIHRGYSSYEIKLILKEFLSDKIHPIRKTCNYNDDIMIVQYNYIKRNPSLFSCTSIKHECMCPNENGRCSIIKENPLYCFKM